MNNYFDLDYYSKYNDYITIDYNMLNRDITLVSTITNAYKLNLFMHFAFINIYFGEVDGLWGERRRRREG